MGKKPNSLGNSQMKAPHSLHLSTDNMIRSEGLDVDDQTIDATIRALLDSDVLGPRLDPVRETLREEQQAPEQEQPVRPASGPAWRYFLDNPPGWRVSLVILVLAILVGWPLLLLGSLGLFMAILAISYFTLGHDRSVEIGLQGFGLLSRFSPRHAEYLKDWAARQTTAMERWLSYLPESWVSGLYLPDFEAETGMPEKMQMDPFDRLYERLRNPDAEL
ncbi:hypothetical protein [Ruegeria sp. PrR005]|uniref:Uncharacterized protein n=1 Tax=Ruegeria sp. PrR005 TaxID=2706882 RepID=A0A6B2NLY4_9RHOB|nr:hypothetical protein [Ruegeria sp. PrR005]NDW45121.1 hypothetical protein [Ruegeria sp. PrR005]